MADLTDLQAAETIKIVGSDLSGVETNAVNADANGNLLVKDYSDGPVTPGTVALSSSLIGGQFNSTLPTLTNTQQSSLQVDSSGRLLVSGLSVDVNPATINITTRDIASTTTTGANGQNFITGSPTASSTASFTFNSEDTVVVQVTGTWTGTLQIEISLDGGTTWSPNSINQDGTSYILNSFTNNFTGRANVAGYTNFRVRSIAAMTGTATVKIVESVNPATVYVGNSIKLVDNSGDTVNVTPNNDMQVADIINTSCIFINVSVTTTATELKVGGSRLANRKMIIFEPLGGDIYFGYSNAVTTTTGILIKKGQITALPIGDAISVFAIAASGSQDTRVQELS